MFAGCWLWPITKSHTLKPYTIHYPRPVRNLHGMVWGCTNIDTTLTQISLTCGYLCETFPTNYSYIKITRAQSELGIRVYVYCDAHVQCTLGIQTLVLLFQYFCQTNDTHIKMGEQTVAPYHLDYMPGQSGISFMTIWNRHSNEAVQVQESGCD